MKDHLLAIQLNAWKVCYNQQLFKFSVKSFSCTNGVTNISDLERLVILQGFGLNDVILRELNFPKLLDLRCSPPEFQVNE